MSELYSAIDLRGFPSKYFSKIGLIKKINIDNLDSALEKIESKDNIISGVEIEDSPQNAKRIIKKLKSIDIIILKGMESKDNREALKMRELTMISNPQNLDKVCFELCKKNQIGIEINAQEILDLNSYKRVKKLEGINDLITAHRKFSFPLVITSGARNPFEIKTPGKPGHR